VERQGLESMHGSGENNTAFDPGICTEGVPSSLNSVHTDPQPDAAFAKALSNARSAWMAAMSANLNRFGVVEFPQQPYLARHHRENCVIVPF